jgi:hypothetical protein
MPASVQAIPATNRKPTKKKTGPETNRPSGPFFVGYVTSPDLRRFSLPTKKQRVSKIQVDVTLKTVSTQKSVKP